MRIPAAATELLTTPTQTITEHDAYKVDGVSTITDVKDILTAAGKDAIASARNSPQLVSQMTQLVVGVKNGTMSKEQALGRLASVVGGNNGVLSKLSNTIKSGMLNQLGIEGKQADAVMSTIGGVVRVAQYGDLSRLDSMIDIFGVVTGNEDLMQMTDLTAEAAFLGGLMKEAISLGVPDAITLLMDQASNDEQRYRIAYDNLGLGINSGDVLTMGAMVDRLGSAVIRSTYPGFVKDFLSRYRRPLGVTGDQYPTVKAEMIAMFVKVDSQWDKALYGSSYIPSLAIFSTISDDARAVFMSTPAHQVQVQLAAYAKEVDIINWIKQNYPYFPG